MTGSLSSLVALMGAMIERPGGPSTASLRLHPDFDPYRLGAR